MGEQTNGSVTSLLHFAEVANASSRNVKASSRLNADMSMFWRYVLDFDGFILTSCAMKG